MFVIALRHPNAGLGRVYLSVNDSVVGYTSDLQRAHVFFEKGDEKYVPWPPETELAQHIMEEFNRQDPQQVKAYYCQECHATSLTPQCMRCDIR